MSYILDALKKSEEERSLGEVPKVASAEAAVPAKKRRSPMPWVIGALLIFNGALLIVFLVGRSGETPVSVESENTPIVIGKSTSEQARSAPPKPVEAPDVLSTAGSPGQQSIADLIEEKKNLPSRVPPRPLDAASELEKSAAPPAEMPILANEPPVVVELIREELAAREMREARRAEEQAVLVPEAPTKVTGQTGIEGSGPTKGLSIVGSPPEYFKAEKPLVAPVASRVGETESAVISPTSPVDQVGRVAVSGVSPVDEVETATRSGTNLVDEEETVTPSQANVSDGESRGLESDPGDSAVAELPLLEQMPADFRQRLPELPINVYVYAEVPEHRFILINMRKYREGSIIDSDLTLETIGHQSITLEFEGRRFRILRP